MSRFLKAASLSDLPPGAATLVEIEGKEVALFNQGGTVYALDNTCPHAGGPLAEGTVGEGKVECPWHGACFDLKTGASSSPLAPRGVRAYPVRVNGADVEIEL
ncbi:MAG: non-heme iron oxygenase ferredoxin subunit [Candidatus Omnitrophota bacterium]|nr:non-heme iron oxygenase ferredoxin subunit [Candidatus Omnitrophota bacterium]